MVEVVFQPIGLADPMRIAPLGHHPIVKRDALCVGHRQRIGLDGPIDRAPHLNDCEAALEQFFRLVGKYLAQSIGSGPFRIIVMGLENRIANEFFLSLGFVPRAQCMIEDHHPRRTRLAPDQFFDLRVVDCLHLRRRSLSLSSHARQTRGPDPPVTTDSPTAARCGLPSSYARWCRSYAREYSWAQTTR